MKITSSETPYLVREPEEINITKEYEDEFIQSRIDAERELMLIALVEGKHIGNCSLMSVGSNNMKYLDGTYADAIWMMKDLTK